MPSNRFPWKAAKASDVLFNAFLRDSTFFQKNFLFSSGAIDILLRIFDIRPGERITLPELREAIPRLDTFFLSCEGLSHAPKLVRDLLVGAILIATRCQNFRSNSIAHRLPAIGPSKFTHSRRFS